MKNFRSTVNDRPGAHINILHRFSRDEQGSFTTTAVFSSLILLLAIGAAIDVNVLHTKKAEAQNLIDNASLSAALALNSENENADDWETPHYERVGEKAFNYDSRFDSSEIQSLKFELSDDGTEVTGSVRLNHSLFFGGILGSKNKNISAKSIVAVGAPDQGTACILILDQNATPGLTLNSGANIDAPDCEISVHSTRNPAVSTNNGVSLNVDKLCVAGSRITNNGGPLSNLETECEVTDNPFNGVFPVPDLTCDPSLNNGNYNGAVVNMTPGVYCGWHNFNNGNAQVTFAPGTYVIRNGGWNVNGGNWEADGVSFYFADRSQINFNSGVMANITAPTSGDYRGVAILEPDGLSNSDFRFNSNGFDITGLVYLPSRNLTFNSGADVTIRDMSFIVNRMMVNNGDLVMSNNTILSEVGNGTGGSVVSPYLSE